MYVYVRATLVTVRSIISWKIVLLQYMLFQKNRGGCQCTLPNNSTVVSKIGKKKTLESERAKSEANRNGVGGEERVEGHQGERHRKLRKGAQRRRIFVRSPSTCAYLAFPCS